MLNENQGNKESNADGKYKDPTTIIYGTRVHLVRRGSGVGWWLILTCGRRASRRNRS